MASLDSDFERKTRVAFLQQVEEQDPGKVLKDLAEENFKDYAREHDYDISHVWEDAGIRTTRAGNKIFTTIEWPALTALFEYGVSPHTIRGKPVLHFFWEAKDQWVKTDEVDWGSETGGIPESRAIRRAINQLRGRIQARGPGGQFR